MRKPLDPFGGHTPRLPAKHAKHPRNQRRCPFAKLIFLGRCFRVVLSLFRHESNDAPHLLFRHALFCAPSRDSVTAYFQKLPPPLSSQGTLRRCGFPFASTTASAPATEPAPKSAATTLSATGAKNAASPAVTGIFLSAYSLLVMRMSECRR